MQHVQQPGQMIGAAVVVAIGKRAPSVRAAVLLIEAAEQVATPTPLLWPDDQRRWIDCLDASAVFDDLVPQFVHRLAGRMNIAVRRVPEAWLVIEDVVAKAA